MDNRDLTSGNFTLKALESGSPSNIMAVAAYTIIPATPVFSIPSGTYATGTTLQISCATTNASVYCTTNGADPTTNSTQIQPTNVLTLTTNVTVKAMAWLGTNASPIASASYIISGPPANDDFTNAVVLSGPSGQFSGTTLASTIEWFESSDIDRNFDNADDTGNSVWYQWTAPSNGTVFLDYSKCNPPGDVIISLYYFCSNVVSSPSNLMPVSLTYDSDYTSETFAATNGTTYYVSISCWVADPFDISWEYVGLTDPPIFSPGAGTYQAPELVTVSDNDPNAVICYTLDGSDPTTNSTSIISGNTLIIATNETLKAAAWRAGLSESAFQTAVYTINASATNLTMTASAPILSPTNSIFTNSIIITLTCTNTGATIYYTLDGSIPTMANASVASGGTVTISNSAILSATAWVTNMNLSPITASQYAEWGVDTASDGIPDTGKLQIGADILIPDAGAVNPNPLAHGLDNLQVYENQSVLIADNYSTENDGIPDWWLVQNGYSVTTPATALGANGQTLLASYLAGLPPNNPSSVPGQTPPIDFHIVHGPSNSLIMVLDTVRSGMATYELTCWNTDQGLPGINEDFPATQSIDQPSNGLGRYFELTNIVPPGFWYFTLQGVNNRQLLSQMSSNTFTSYQNANYGFENGADNFNGDSELGSSWARYSGLPIPVVGYTNKNALKEPLLAQMLRKESDVSEDWTYLKGVWIGWSGGPVVYNDAIPQSITTETSWGTLAFSFAYGGYSATNFASYFTAFCATPDSPYDCDANYSFLGSSVYFPGSELTPLAVSNQMFTFNYYFVMPTNSFNPAGLAYLSATYRIDGESPMTLTPGDSVAVPGSFGFEAALQTETPSFQTVNYYFDGRQYPLNGANVLCQRSAPPVEPPDQIAPDGWMLFSYFGASTWPLGACITNPVIIAQVGRPVNLQAWRQVIAVGSNGAITNQSYWIDQDFAAAYLCDSTNGDVARTSSTNYNGKFMIATNATVTGILSASLDYTNVANSNPYFGQRGASFTPTQPGKVIVTTTPDSNGFYGEVTIYAIDMQVDANHDGVMDNRDLTSADNPMQFWVNNDIDRGHVVDGSDWEQDDLLITDPSLTSYLGNPFSGAVIDCNYHDPTGELAIPSQRDLEDYARLWLPGFSNMMANLPTNYGVTLLWRNNTGAEIRLFRATETNGGTNYLFDTNTANAQTNFSLNPCYGYVSANQPLDLGTEYRTWISAPPPNCDHYIFCGCSNGNDELVLQVTNQFGGEVGEASVFINLQDIKQMYERWVVGNDYDATQPIPNIAVPASDNLPPGGTSPYPYDALLDVATPYILFVHGWNMAPWEKDRYAETAYKRLYWQGYQGRFGEFRWPTFYDFPFGELSFQSFDPNNFDKSEYNSWQSAIALETRLVALDIQYPGNAYVIAHSMGNIATGESLRLAGTPLVNTYVAMQGAVPAHAYDPTTTTRTIPFPFNEYMSDYYANYWTNGAPCYFTNAVGSVSYINFFNAGDWALSWWQTDQNAKPDTLPGYAYIPTNFYLNAVLLSFPTNTYQIFAFGDQAPCYALGAQANVGGQFSFRGIPQQVDLSLSPYNFSTQHKYHSGQFRSDNMDRAVFWNQLLIQMNLENQ